MVALDTPVAALVAELVKQLGKEAVRTQVDDLTWYGSDRCKGGWPVAPSVAVLPRTVSEVQTVVRACASRGIPIVPSGGRTGLAGGATATAGELVLSLDRMNAIDAVDRAARTVHCEAGATVGAVHAAAAAVGLSYPVDWAAAGTAHVGGSVATNAGGIRVVRYGSTRRWVRGLEVVLADGSVARLGREVIKDNTGYDLRQLFIGSEGTLGVIVGVTLGLTEPPADRVVALCGASDLASVVAFFARARATPGLTISAFECFDHGCIRHVLSHRGSDGAGPFPEDHGQYALIEVETGIAGEEATARERLQSLMMDALEAGEIDDAVVAANDAQAARVWAWREEISESIHVHTPHKADVSVPLPALTEFVLAWREAAAEELADVEALCFGHVGDGNVHLNLLRPSDLPIEEFAQRCHAFDERAYALVRDAGGSVSAEHGIGLLKRHVLHYSRSEVELSAMRAIKRALDPEGLFNPGKVL
jgi:FAD/FMN-containing dehydrogenase